MHYELHDPHFHWHLQSFVTFELWRADGTGEPVRDRKTGFCLVDRWGRFGIPYLNRIKELTKDQAARKLVEKKLSELKLRK